MKRAIIITRIAGILLTAITVLLVLAPAALAKTYVITDGDRAVTYTASATDPTGTGATTEPYDTGATRDGNLTDNRTVRVLLRCRGEEIALTSTNAEGISVNSLWDGVTHLSVSAGERICLDVKVIDAFFAEELGGTAARYLLLGYCADGQDYEVGIPYYMIQRLGQPFLYLAAAEGLDVIGYAQALRH